MREKPFVEHKTALTPAEKLRVAVAVLVWGWDQHKVAALMDVNPGRVAEAVVAIRAALNGEHPEPQPDLLNDDKSLRLLETRQ